MSVSSGDCFSWSSLTNALMTINKAIYCTRQLGMRIDFPRYEVAHPNKAYTARAASSAGNIAITAG